MDKAEVLDKLRDIIKPYVQDEAALADLGEETDLLNDLHINSAHLVDIILDVEDAFDIEIDDTAAEQMMTVKDAVAIILDQMST